MIAANTTPTSATIASHMPKYPTSASSTMITFTDFNDGAAGCSLSADFVKGSDTVFVSAGKNNSGTVYKIYILSAEIFDCINDLLRKRSGDIRCHNCLLNNDMCTDVSAHIGWKQYNIFQRFS